MPAAAWANIAVFLHSSVLVTYQALLDGDRRLHSKVAWISRLLCMDLVSVAQGGQEHLRLPSVGYAGGGHQLTRHS
jgi:hypothetical protein